MNRLLVAPLLSLLAAAAPGALLQDPVFQRVPYEEALASARSQGRLLVVFFAEAECDDCERLRQKTWTHDAVQRWLEVEAVAVEIDAGSRPDLVESFALEGYPTVLLLDGIGTEYHRFTGFFKARGFVNVFRGVNAGRLSLRLAQGLLAEDPENPQLRVDLARALAQLGLKQRALDEYEAIWDSCKGADEHRRTRLVTVPIEVNMLSSGFAPARKTLLRWRILARRVLDGKGPGDPVVAARELSAVNRHTRRAEDQLAVWEELRAREEVPPEVLDTLFDDQVIMQLYKRGRFEELAENLGDTLVRAERLVSDLEDHRRRAAEGLLLEEEIEATSVFENLLVVKTTVYFETLLRVGRVEEAEDLQSYVLTHEPSKHGFATLMTAARRARHRELARQIGDAGLAALKGKERQLLLAEYELLFGGPQEQ